MTAPKVPLQEFLRAFDTDPPPTLYEVARKFGYSQAATVLARVSTLVDHGLMESTTHAETARKYRLTDEGRLLARAKL